MYDVIVIGAGAAGLSAALWCEELGLKTLILEADAEIGGQLLWVYNQIENHLGAVATDGREMRDKFKAQIEMRKFEIRLNARVARADLLHKQIHLENGEIYAARALVLATGIKRRKLNVPGENEFRGRGIIESGKRDASLIAGKNVCIVGGGDAACENALILSESAKRVFLVHRRDKLSARPEFTEQIMRNPRIDIFFETQVRCILGESSVTGVELQNVKTGEIQRLAVEAFLLRIGVCPNTEFVLDQIELDKNGYIKIDSSCQTSLEGVFAVGDVANPLAPTISSSVGMGATAAKVLYAALQ